MGGPDFPRLPDIRLIIFDLGGVLADLGQPATAMGLPLSDSDFWGLWLTSPAARSFENGVIGERDFLERMPRELRLDDAPDKFRERFLRWRLTLYPGIRNRLAELRSGYEIGLLSNTNSLHWSMIEEQGVDAGSFDHVFLSYEMRCSKPTDAVFEHLLGRVLQPCYEILFLDDTRVNVEAAQRFGIHARQVAGPEALAAALADL